MLSGLAPARRDRAGEGTRKIRPFIGCAIALALWHRFHRVLRACRDSWSTRSPRILRTLRTRHIPLSRRRSHATSTSSTPRLRSVALAFIVATRLRGKHYKPMYTPHIDCGDSIIVVNIEKVVTVQARGEAVLLAHRPSGGHQAADWRRFWTTTLEQGDRRQLSAWTARPPRPRTNAETARLQGPEHRIRRSSRIRREMCPQAPRTNAVSRHGPDYKFRGIDSVCQRSPGDCGAGRTRDRSLWPGLCDGKAQERCRPRLDRSRDPGRSSQRPRRGRFFARPTLRMVIDQPFIAANRAGRYGVLHVTGGGLSGEPARCGTASSRAPTRFEPALRPTLKAADFPARDPRVVEHGRLGEGHVAQFSKR